MRKKRPPTPENPYVIFALALNYLDPDQRRMIEHIQSRTNYSAYLQRIVQRDMDGSLIQQKIEPDIEDEAKDGLDIGLMQELI